MEGPVVIRNAFLPIKLREKLGATEFDLVSNSNPEAATAADTWYIVRVTMDGPYVTVERAAPDGDFIELLSTDQADADMTTGRIYFGAAANQTYHYDDCTFNVAETTQVTMDEDHAVTAVYVWDDAKLAENGGTLYGDFDGLDENHDEEIELSEASLTQGEFNDLLREFDTDSDDMIDLSEAQAAARLRIASDLGVFLNAIGCSADPYTADYNNGPLAPQRGQDRTATARPWCA